MFRVLLSGITIIGYSYYFLDADNIIIRGIKFRNGYPDDNGASNVQMRRCTNVIVDRCSFSYGNKGININSDSNTTANVTIQNNLIGEMAQGALIGNSNGDEIEAGDWTFARNVIGNVAFRMPKMGGRMSGDIVNNIYHNWDRKGIRFDGNDYRINFKSNYWQKGVDYDNAIDPIITTWTDETMNPDIYDDGLSYFSPDLSADYGNYPNPVSDVWSLFNVSTYPIQSSWFNLTETLVSGRTIPVLPTLDLKTELLPTVGATYYIDNNGNFVYQRDSIDQLLVDKIDTDSNDARIDGTTYQTLAEAIVSANNTRPVDFYGVNQHIPTAWLTANGYSDTTIIHNQIEPDGYTVLEHYINQVDEGQVVNIPQITRTDNNPTSIVVGGVYTPPTGTWTDVEDGSGAATVGGDTVDVNTIGTYNVTIVDVTGVTVTPSTASINIGQTTTLTETIAPVNATDQTGVWASSNGSVATVDQSGRVTGVSVGSSTISFTANDTAGGVFTDTCVVTVSEAPQGGQGKLRRKKKIITIINN
jgi:uncharacterized protein YjdB